MKLRGQSAKIVVKKISIIVHRMVIPLPRVDPVAMALFRENRRSLAGRKKTGTFVNAQFDKNMGILGGKHAR
jgi:hypothetical protein